MRSDYDLKMVAKRSLRWKEGQDASGAEILPEEDLRCPLCDRLMVLGPTVDEHHLTPRSQGGREKFRLHKVCHLKIHQALKPRELARQYNTWESLRTHPEVAKFIDWVKKRPPEFLG
jgi:hypothetical protein